MAITDSIASLIVGQGQAEAEGLRERGRIRAEEAIRKRQFWGNTLRDIAGLAMAIPQQIAERKQANLQAQVIQSKLDAEKRGQAINESVNQIMQQAMIQKPDGTRVMDRGKLRDMFTKNGIPVSAQEQAFKSIDEVEASLQKFNDVRAEHFADMAHGVLSASKSNEPVSMDALAFGIAHAKANGLLSDDQLKPLVFAAASGEDLRPFLRQIRSQSPKYKDVEKPVKLAPAETLVNPETKEVVAAGGPKPITNRTELELDAANSQSPTQAQSAAALASLQKVTPYQEAQLAATTRAREETERHNRASEAEARRRLEQEESVPTLSPEGLDAVALSFAKTGQLPPMGRGKKGDELRTKIINRAAEMNPSLDLASNRAAFKANEGALSALQKQRDAIGAFEQTATKNIDLFLDQAGKVVDTGSPLANALVRNVSGSVLGSPNVAAFNAARQVAINEIAKITSNPNLSGQLSDTARKEVEAFNPSSATLKQSVAVMRLLKKDMQNRTGALDDQIDAIKSRISGKASEAKPEEWVRDKSGKLVKKGG